MNTTVKEKFPIRLKELRAKKGLNQEQLAKELNIGRASISNYEIGSRLPDADVIFALADYFQVSTDYLIGRTNMQEEKIDSTHELISKLSQVTEELGPSQKSDLFRALKAIIEMINIDKLREQDRSVFCTYATILENLSNFDKETENRLAYFFATRKDEENDPFGNNVASNLNNYYMMFDNIKEAALSTGTMISHLLRVDVVLCALGQKEMLNKWVMEELAECENTDVNDEISNEYD